MFSDAHLLVARISMGDVALSSSALFTLAMVWLRLRHRSRDRERLQRTATALADRGAENVRIRHGRYGRDEILFDRASPIVRRRSSRDSPSAPDNVVLIDEWKTDRDNAARRAASATRRPAARRPR